MAKPDRYASPDDGSKLNQLIGERNRLITELYCVSRIQDFLHITDEQLLASQINEFLDLHDIRKGYRFDSNSLPRFTQSDPPSEKKPAKSKSSTPVDNTKRDREYGRHDKDDNRRAPEGDKESAKDGRGILVRDVRSKSYTSPHSQKKEDGVGSEMSNVNQSGTHGETHETYGQSDMKRLREDEITPRMIEEQCRVPESQLVSPSSTPSVPYNVAKRQKLSILSAERKENRRKPSRRTNYLIRQLRHEPDEGQKLFDQNNLNARESVYLVMKENIPSIIPQATPLSELKFNSQTLPLIKLIPAAHKVLTSEIMNSALNECRIAVVSSRIEELRRSGLWSLRQPKKFLDPWDQLKDVETHWGTLLEEAKWLFYDFDEFNKYKRAACFTMAQAVMDFWNYGQVCCIRRAPIKHIETEQDSSKIASETTEENCDTKEAPLQVCEADFSLYPHRDTTNESVNVELLLKRPDPSQEIPALDIPTVNTEVYAEDIKKRTSPFKLHISFDDFGLVERKILDDVPIYSGITNKEASDNERSNICFEPISKSTVLLDDDHYLKIAERQIIEEEPSLIPFSKRRGMFYGNRRSHYLRPPIAPSLRYLRCRTPTIWLPQDDQNLVKNINTYAYNWELISAHMSSRSTRSYCSNIERRTPWQCFERFIQLNEKFQFIDMKGPRAHNAQLWLIEAHKLQQQQKRRISPLGVGEESIQRGHKRLRWASMFEAMRKCIKKRENAPRPNPAQPRKPLDCKNTTVPTPAEMSQLKAQRDDALRRDIQMRRLAKQKLQAAAMSQVVSNSLGPPPQSSPSSVQRRPANNGLGPGRINSADSNMRVTTQIPKQSPVKQYPKAFENEYKVPVSRQKQTNKPAQSHGEKLNKELSTEKIVSPTPQEILQKLQGK
ncbi:LADA_0B03048g1_1 [Lachancea dasiensis]|uniref:Chromatin modification-related protein EAF1 n=1 Tax=Lachancea dasiensis TaxID=1072105 RepID=A0A1G4ISI9_9SACH|nr:LADA_0B03048g1_1 [Lachancea dasiensis]